MSEGYWGPSNKSVLVAEFYLTKLAQQRRKQMRKEIKIDWTKPLEVELYGKWHKARVLATDVKHPTNKSILVAYFVPNDNTEYFARFSVDGDNNLHWAIRNVQEPRCVWFNVYKENKHMIFWHDGESIAREGKSYVMTYIHTLKVNLDTGETEKLYL